MINNKKGLSDVVSTVLIILLVLAAVGIIGAIVLRNVGNSGKQIDAATVCASNTVIVTSCVDGDVAAGVNNPIVSVQRLGGSDPISTAAGTTPTVTSYTAGGTPSTPVGITLAGIGSSASAATTQTAAARAVATVTYVPTGGAPVTCTSAPVICA